MTDKGPGLMLLTGLILAGVFIALYLHYKGSERRSYFRWKEDFEKLNPNGPKLLDRPPWEYPPGEGPNAFTFYI